MIALYSDRAKPGDPGRPNPWPWPRRAPATRARAPAEGRCSRKGRPRTRLDSDAGGRPDAVDQAVEALIAKTPRVEGGSGQLYMNPDIARVFATAEGRRQGRRRRLRHHPSAC